MKLFAKFLQNSVRLGAYVKNHKAGEGGVLPFFWNLVISSRLVRGKRVRWIFGTGLILLFPFESLQARQNVPPGHNLNPAYNMKFLSQARTEEKTIKISGSDFVGKIGSEIALNDGLSEENGSILEFKCEHYAASSSDDTYFWKAIGEKISNTLLPLLRCSPKGKKGKECFRYIISINIRRIINIFEEEHISFSISLWDNERGRIVTKRFRCENIREPLDFYFIN